MKMIRMLLVTIAVLGSSVVQAAGQSDGVLLQLTPSYSSRTTNSGSDSTTTTLQTDFTLGYILSSGLALGLRYDMTSTTTSPGSKTDNTGYGPAIGFYHDSGFFGLFSYLLSYEIKTDTGKTTGDGMSLDLGYIYRFGTFGLGAQLTWYSLVLKKSIDSAGNETTLPTSTKITGYGVPGVVMNWIF